MLERLTRTGVVVVVVVDDADDGLRRDLTSCLCYSDLVGYISAFN